MTAFPVTDVRAQFPALARGEEGPVFLDNPAGTQLPRQAMTETVRAMEHAASNLGGAFTVSHAAGEINHRAHAAMADMFGADSGREIVIGPSMTTLTLHMSRSIGRLFQPGDDILLTRMDHEGNVAPWLMLARDLGLNVKFLPFNRDSWQIEPEDLQAALGPRTRLLALSYASNMTGSINRVRELSAMARAAGALVYVDAVQFMPHVLPDVGKLDCDFMVCSSYKFFGPHLGILWAREDVLQELVPYKCRCAPDEPPGTFETGTPQTELLAGLCGSIAYLEWLGGRLEGLDDDAIGNCSLSVGPARRARLEKAYAGSIAYERDLCARLIDGIRQIPGTVIHGISNPNRFDQRVPTVSFTHDHVATHEFARTLAANHVNIWSGHNYALEATRYLGLPEDQGVVRIGIAHYNLAEEIDRTLELLNMVAQKR